MRRLPLALALLLLLLPAAPAAASTRGEQRLLVVLVEHAHSGCPADATGLPTCPRHDAATWQRMLDERLNAFFRVESGGRASWRVRVVANPGQTNGWWPAPHTRAQYDTPGNDNFRSSVSIVRDAAEVLMQRAIRQGAISLPDVLAHNRLLVIDNFHRRGGQSSGGAGQWYTPFGVDTIVGRIGFSWFPTAAVAAEDASDLSSLSVIVHEVGHELGEPDLYSQTTCPLLEPGGVRSALAGDDADCVGDWDMMALDFRRQPGFGVFTRELVGWVDRVPAQIRYESRSFTGDVVLSRLQQPTGEPLAVRFPDEPFFDAVARGFGSSSFKGLQAECRRRVGNDVGLPGEGVVVSYVDTARGGAHPQYVVRRTATQAVQDAVLDEVGDVYENRTLGVKLTYTGATPAGGCRLAVNRTPVRLIAAFIPRIPFLPGFFAAAATAASPAGSRSAFGLQGVSVNARSSTTGAAGRRVRLRPVRRGRPALLRFAYGNAGAARGTGTATVRVSEPYTAEQTCGGPPTAGRVVRRMRLSALAPGAVRTASLRYRPRTSSGTLGVAVGFGPGAATTQSALAFRAFPRARKGRRAPAQTLTIAVKAGRTCSGPQRFSLAPLALPRGWQLQVTKGTTVVRPGRTATLRLRLRPPAGARSGAIALPVAVQAGVAGAPGQAADLPAGPTVIGGLDVLAGVGRSAAAPLLPAGPVPPAPVGYPRPPVLPPAFPTPTPGFQQPPAPPQPPPTTTQPPPTTTQPPPTTTQPPPTTTQPPPTTTQPPPTTTQPPPTTTQPPATQPKGASSISLTCPEQLVTTGQESASFSGMIDPVHVGVAVRVVHTPPSTSQLDPVEHVVTTDGKGVFRDEQPATADGDWVSRASWAGDDDHEGATSKPCGWRAGPG